MKASFHFTHEPDWRLAPLAYWVHVPVVGCAGQHHPPLPAPVLHKGYAFLHVPFERHELIFSAPAQLDHCIDVLSARPLPTSRQLSARRGPDVGPNGHWLSRLPAALKSPRRRERLIVLLKTVQIQTAARWPAPSAETTATMATSRKLDPVP